ncbi:MAG: DnaJ domain-containing protein [Xanthomonadales bacterium]|nr:DnaJ domain-containing protein [Xanthomonadales bacterium]
MESPYEILGVATQASAEDIKKAYRRLARKLHPDLNAGDKGGEERFKAVSAAYRLLSDPDTRARYDAGEIDEMGVERPQRHYYRDHAGSAQADAYASDAGHADFMDGEDAFAEMLRQAARARANRRGQDLHYRLAVTFAEAVAGGMKRLTLPLGGVIDVNLPPGVVDGQILRLKGKGAAGAGEGEPGDALVELEIAADPRFTREGEDVVLDLPISLGEAVLGGRVRVPTPTGAVEMSVPPGASSGTTLRLKGQGLPRKGGTRGDERVRLRIVLPKGRDEELERFVAGWQAGKDFDPRAEVQP